ncbi:LysR family transcriptional regulator [uncultured Leclercia sp.]|uniref:LysR family transcriptional regulator n=1 Tax=uncultured Leclercia sp. TaxID=332959 RepID=UPI0025974316|nr:LysR family transcriptional regulator [uncultured Leclercia sp.]
MNKLTALQIYRRVIELGSFRAAADDLNLSQAAISKNVSELETELRTPLIVRTTRKMTPTAQGLSYYSQICTILDSLIQADAAVRSASSRPEGLLRISAPMSFGLTVINNLITAFAEAYPDITVELEMTDEYSELIENSFDVAIRGGAPLSSSSLKSRRIASVSRILCASPDYLANSAPVSHPDDLSRQSCLIYSLSSSPQTWSFTKEKAERNVKVGRGRYTVNNSLALLEAGRAGLGIILVPRIFAQRDLNDGLLLQVMQDWLPVRHALYAVYPFHKSQQLSVRIFIDFITEKLSNLIY